MAIRVQVPGHGIVEFPDGTSEDQMRAAIARLNETPKPAEEKSVGGFVQNLVSSGAKFATDTVEGVKNLAVLGGRLARAQGNPTEAAKIGQDFIALVKNSPEVGKAVFGALKDRYGSGQAILDTLYKDPVGVLADVSTVVGGVGGAAKGVSLAGRTAPVARIAPSLAGRAKDVADIALAAERLTNPLTLPGRAAAGAADLASDAVITATVRPSAALRKTYGGSGKIARAIKNERVVSSELAERKLGKSVAEADKLISESNAPGIAREDLVVALEDAPLDTAGLRAQLGNPGAVDTVANRIDALEATMPETIPLDRAHALRREAGELAYEATTQSNSLEHQMNKALERALRKAIQDRVPEIGDIDARSRRLVAAKKALAAAEDRPSGLTNTLIGGAVGAGVGFGFPEGGLLSAAIMKGLDSPRAGSLVGNGINEAGRTLANPAVQRGALGARSLNDELLQLLMERMEDR
jgi:hypothetical protein